METMTRRWGELDDPVVFELRAIAPDRSKKPQSAKFAADWIDEAVEWSEQLNRLGFNLYVTRNPIRHDCAGSAKDEDVVAAFYVWADCDDKAASNNVFRFDGPKWSFAVTTGRVPHVRAHTYWELEEPCLNMQAWRDVQAGIAVHFGSDDKVVNPSRIMRLGGTVTYPDKNKIERGYTTEVASIRTVYDDDRDAVEFMQMHRLFGHLKPHIGSQASAQPLSGGFHIDMGKQAMDRAMVEQAIVAGGDWHNNVIKLVASYVAKGLTDSEIHALTDRFTMDGYTVDDTRREVQQAIDGARAKGWTPSPDPVAERMQKQNETLHIATEPTGAHTESGEAVEWPTPYETFDALSIPRREWVYGYDYVKKYISVTASAGGIGKTSLTIVEALAICTGNPLLGVTVRQTENVWLINLEDPRQELEMRTIAAMHHYGLTPSDVRGKLFMDGEDTMHITLAAESRDGLIQNDALLEHITRKVKENNIGVIVLDPFVSAHLVNENNNGSIQAVVAMLRKLARDTNSSVQLVHHIRKGNGDDATIDSVRGAGSLIGAARAARVINRITPDDAMALGVDEHEALGIFRVDDGKANLAPPSDKAIYRRMQSVEIANGEHIGVATEFKLPDLFDGVTTKDLYDVQRTVAEAEKNNKAYRADVRAKNWIGVAIAEKLDLDLDKPKDKAKAKAIAKQWIISGSLKVADIPDKRAGRDVPCVVVGEWINWDEV